MNTATADPWKLLVRDFAFELMEEVKSQKTDVQSDDPFVLGRRTAYYELLDRLRQEVGAFGLDVRDVGLDTANLERDIL